MLSKPWFVLQVAGVIILTAIMAIITVVYIVLSRLLLGIPALMFIAIGTLFENTVDYCDNLFSRFNDWIKRFSL